MTPTPEVQERLRRYLLGQVAEDAREEIEKDLLTSDELFEELLVIEDEIIDQYLAGQLNSEDRTAFERYFLATPERSEKLSFGRVFNRYLAASQPTPLGSAARSRPAPWARTRPFFSSPIAIGVFALLIVGIAFGVWRIFFYESDVDKGLRALNAAYREQRPIQSRISALSYAPFPETRGPNDPGRFDPILRMQAESTLSNALNERAEAKTYHAVGQVFLAKRQFDEAIKQFDEADKAGSNNPKLYSDLGAAWLEKGKLEQGSAEAGKGAADFARAFANFNKAIELDSKLLDARFNRALCLQFMRLPDQAEEAWREYLKLDSTSPWATEAAHNLKQLERREKAGAEVNPVEDFLRAFKSKDDDAAWRLISRNRNLSGGPIANTFIDTYLEAKAGSDQANEALQALSYVASLEKQRAGDLFVQDVLQQISALPAPQRAVMWDGRRLLKQGQEALWQANSSAIDSLTQARDIYEKLGVTSEATYVQYPIAHFLLGQKKSYDALAALTEVVRTSRARQYKWLTAQALNATANTQIGLANHSAALEASQASLALSKEIGDTSGTIKTTSQLASEYFRLGNYSRSLDLHQQSLAAAEVTPPEPMQMWRNYFGIAMPLEALGLHAAAIEYEKEALRRADQMNQLPEISRSYSLLGLMYAGYGNFQEAARNGEAGLEVARKLPGDRPRQEAVAYSMLQLGWIYRQSGDQSKAISNYDQAIAGYQNLDNFEAFSYVAHKGKLLACLNHPGCDFAEKEITTCLDLFNRFRANIREVSIRLPFFDTEQDIYDIAIGYEYAKGNFPLSFEYAEQARASSLRDLTQRKGKLIQGAAGPDVQVGTASASKSLAEIQAGVPPDAQVIQYSLLPDKIIIWMVSRDEFVHEEQAIPLAQLNGILDRYLKLVSSPSAKMADLAEDGGALYRLLIQPIAARLDRDKLLCIVPDKKLNYLPFAALIPAPGKYLVNEFKLLRAPSSSMFIASSQNAATREKVESESLLAVGNPRFDRDEFPDLGDLPSAASEARAITGGYDRSRTRVFTDNEATKNAVMVEMHKSNVVHLALHSLVDEQSPWRSRLILARSASNSGPDDEVLEAYEVYEIGLPVTRLVVLSACDTAVGRYYGGEGVMGLSVTFLATGVPLVVASLWPIDSDSTTELMIAFHKHRKAEKLSTVEALQRAQEDMLNSSEARYREPYYWAGLTVAGGYATF